MNTAFPKTAAQPWATETIDLPATDLAYKLSSILTAVIGYTELCIDESQKGTLSHGRLSRVLGAANQGKELIHEILGPGQPDSELAAPRSENAWLPSGTENIFLVGADWAIVEMQQQLLESLGYKVVIRTCSMEALEAFRQNKARFDAVIADMAMPDLSGDQLALEVKKIRPDIPVLLSVGPARANRAGSNKAHADGFLAKPLGRAEMAKAVRSALDRSRGSAAMYLYSA
ncbi:MAG: response regulator [Desulfobacteraceae bacterium]|nr:response regulator [Desulfobacteraceae bacterium]